MPEKLILLIEDDSSIENRLKDILKKDYKLEIVKTASEAVKFLEQNSPALILLDFDLKREDGLQVFYKINYIHPDIKIVMLSFSGSIPLAVTATKAGVADFLRKPLNSEHVLDTVKRNFFRPEEKLSIPQQSAWLHGESSSVKKFLHNIKIIVPRSKDIILLGEKGIDKVDVAKLIHNNGVHKKRKFNSINLADFQIESLETHFWTILRKLMSIPDTSSLQDEKDLCGTIYIENMERGSEDFLLTFFKFLEKRQGSIDKTIRVIIDIRNKGLINKLKLEKYDLIQIPSLRERKADISSLLNYFLNHYSGKYNKEVKFISAEALRFLSSYDYPGNYIELAKLIQGAVLGAQGDSLEIKDLAINYKELSKTVLKAAKEDGFTLEETRAAFENKLYAILLDKFAGDVSATAQFLDMPKTAFEKRCAELKSSFVN